MGTHRFGPLSVSALRFSCAVLLLAFIGCGGWSREGGRFGDDDGGSGPASPERVGFVLSCGICGADPADLDLWRSDFSSGFLGENETCAHAPSMLVDANPETGWAEGAEGVGIGARVIIPKRLDLHQPIRIWAGYGKSPELFEANGRPKSMRVTVLRLRADEPDAHDATGCSQDAFVEPVAVAEHEVTLRDFNGYQALPLPEFQIEQYMEYPREWLLMDGSEREHHEQLVAAGRAEPFRRISTDFAYFIELTLLEVYPGTRYEDTVISEVGNEPPP